MDTNLLGRTVAHPSVGSTRVAVAVEAALRTARISVLVTRSCQRTDTLCAAVTGLAVGRTLVAIGGIGRAVAVTSVGTGGCTPTSVHTHIHIAAVADLCTVSVVVAVQSTIAVVPCTTIATRLVVVPFVAQRSLRTDLFDGAGALAASRRTVVAIAAVAAIAGVTHLVGVPLVACGGGDTRLYVSTRTLTASRRTLVAITVVTTVGTTAAGHPGVLAAVYLTHLGAGA